MNNLREKIEEVLRPMLVGTATPPSEVVDRLLTLFTEERARLRREAQKCPVCYGTGSVGAGFYTNGVAGTSTVNIECRSCSGKGFIVLSLLSVPNPTPHE